MRRLITAVVGGGVLAMSAVARMLFDAMITTSASTALFLIRSNSEFWRQFYGKDCVVVKNIDRDEVSFKFEFQIKQDGQSYEEFIAQCVDNSRLGIVFYDNLEETVNELKLYTHTFSTCCGSAFNDVVEQIAKGHEGGECFEIVGFENDHSNIVDRFPA